MIVIRIGFEPMTYCLEGRCSIFPNPETLYCSGFQKMKIVHFASKKAKVLTAVLTIKKVGSQAFLNSKIFIL
jgi:hypothetical protein